MSSLALFAAEGADKLNIPAVIMFLVFIVATMGITKWAASKTKSASDFYTAGGGISGFQNGLALKQLLLKHEVYECIYFFEITTVLPIY